MRFLFVFFLSLMLVAGPIMVQGSIAEGQVESADLPAEGASAAQPSGGCGSLTLGSTTEVEGEAEYDPDYEALVDEAMYQAQELGSEDGVEGQPAQGEDGGAGTEADFDACKQLGLQPNLCDNFEGEIYCADENCKLVGPCTLAADGSVACP